jgi:hypothetical protein
VATDRDDRRLAAPGDLELVRDFVNSLDFLPDTDELDAPANLASWLIEHRLVAALPTLTEMRISHEPGACAKRCAHSC